MRFQRVHELFQKITNCLLVQKKVLDRYMVSLEVQK